MISSTLLIDWRKELSSFAYMMIFIIIMMKNKTRDMYGKKKRRDNLLKMTVAFEMRTLKQRILDCGVCIIHTDCNLCIAKTSSPFCGINDSSFNLITNLNHSGRRFHRILEGRGNASHP